MRLRAINLALAALSLLLAESLTTSVFGAEMTGKVDKVVDGDTFWICDPNACHKIRLCGIDAPEAALANLIVGPIAGLHSGG